MPVDASHVTHTKPTRETWRETPSPRRGLDARARGRYARRTTEESDVITPLDCGWTDANAPGRNPVERLFAFPSAMLITEGVPYRDGCTD